MTRQPARVPGCVALVLFVGANALAVCGQSRTPDANRLPGASYPDVIALHDSKQPAAALAALDSRLRDLSAEAAPVEALALRAQLLSANGRHLESVAVWRDIADRESALRVVALTAILDNQLARGSMQDAQEVLADISAASSIRRVDLVIRVAAACRSAGLNEQGVTLYRRARQQAAGTPLADEASLGLAAALEASGRPADALGVVRELLLTFRTPNTYATAVAQVQRLSMGLAQSPEPVTEREYESIADRLSAAADFRQAIDVLTTWRETYPDSPNLARIDAAIIENLYNMRANVEARARCSLFVDRYPTSSERPAVSITQFRLDVREGRTADARARGLAIWRGQPGNATPDDRRSVARLLAEYLVSVGEAKDGLAVYDELYQATPGRGNRIDVLWRSAIAAVRAGREERATEDLRRVLGLTPGSETVRAATYWLAAIEDTRGAHDAAARHWMTLVGRYPYSYYGVRAADRLGKRRGTAAASSLAAAPHPTFPDLSLSESVTNHRDYRSAMLLARTGLLSDAASYAVRLTQIFPNDTAVALLAARAAAAAGQYRTAFRLATSRFGPYLERPADNLPDDLWSLAYPLAYWADIQIAARRHGVDPLLMVALMQQESQFDPGARSPAGAIGLFQIMPSTAERVRIGLGIDRVDADDLTQPGISAEIAATLLGDLIKLFGGELAPAIAAYNAGEDRVQAWWQAARGAPEELFIDSIPYRETRGYVREVLANYFTYRRLNGN